MKLASILVACAISTSPLAAQAKLFELDGAPGSHFASSIARLGDVDGDGRADFLVGADAADGLAPNSGVVDVVSTKSASVLYQFRGLHAGDRVGAAVASIGDIDGDSIADFVVGAPGLDNGPTLVDCGGFYVVSGANGAILHTIFGAHAGLQVGEVLAAVGDLDLDGVIDFAVGIEHDDTTASDAGAVELYSGASSTLIHTFYGAHVGDHFGGSVAGAGRFDADATPDLIIGAPHFDTGTTPFYIGRAYIYSGAPPYALITNYTGTFSWGKLGWSVGGGFDANGDGFDDVIVGEPWADSNGVDSGRAVVIGGGGAGVLFDLVGGAAGDRFGLAVGCAGDFDGDGAPDFMVGAPGFDSNSLVDRGRVVVFRGSNASVLATFDGFAPQQAFGTTLACIGFVNADHVADLALGSSVDFAAPTIGGALEVVLGGVSAPTTYCTAKVNSRGCTPAIFASGLPTLSVADDFHVGASSCLVGKPGMLLWSPHSSGVPFDGGTLCLGDSIARTPIQFAATRTVGACGGSYDFHVTQNYMTSVGLAPGSSFYAQIWMRDPGFVAPNDVGLTDALSAVVLP